jgi:peptide/nickel transport system substrate-binding protein
MKRTLVISIALAVAVAACAQTTPTAPGASTGPARGGAVVLVTGHEPQTLDPHFATGVYDGYISFMLADPLIKLKPGGILVPGLAESWERPDPTTYVLRLRKNVTFQDGTPFNADAVKYNFDRLFDPATKAPRAKADLGMLKEVVVVDPYTVKMTTTFPYGPFLATIAGRPLAVIESPTALRAAGVANYGTKPVGAGPFILKEWVQGDRLVLVANDNYWAGRPYIDSLTLQVVKDPATRLSMLQTGAAQFNVELNPADFAGVKQSTEFEAQAAPFDNTLFLEMSNVQKPFDDPRVRQAVCYAIDKQAIIKSVLLGLPQPGSGVFPATTWAKNANVEKYSYDPQKAKQLLTEAGYANGFTTTFWHPSGRYSGDSQVAQAVQGYLRQVGITANLKTGDLTAWANAMRGSAPDKPDAPLYMRGWGVSGDPDSQINVLYNSSNWGIAGNYARYKNPKVDSLVVAAQRETDQSARAMIYQQAEALITSDAPLCTLYENVRLLAWTKKLHDVQVGPGEYQFFDRAWLGR